MNWINLFLDYCPFSPSNCVISTTSVLSNLDKTHHLSSELFNFDHILLHWSLSLEYTLTHNFRDNHWHIEIPMQHSHLSFGISSFSNMLFNEFPKLSSMKSVEIRIRYNRPWTYLNARNSILTNKDVAPLIHSLQFCPLLPENESYRNRSRCDQSFEIKSSARASMKSLNHWYAFEGFTHRKETFKSSNSESFNRKLDLKGFIKICYCRAKY